MKKVLSLFISVCLIISMSVAVYASMIYTLKDPKINFNITSQGLAICDYFYVGDASTNHVKITIKLEKRTLLLFWTDVEEWTVTSYATEYSGEKTYQLTDGGTYRCTVILEETLTNGTVETTEYKLKAEYDPA